jgi:hypothetical protein
LLLLLTSRHKSLESRVKAPIVGAETATYTVGIGDTVGTRTTLARSTKRESTEGEVLVVGGNGEEADAAMFDEAEATQGKQSKAAAEYAFAFSFYRARLYQCFYHFLRSVGHTKLGIQSLTLLDFLTQGTSTSRRLWPKCWNRRRCCWRQPPRS